MAVFWVEVPCSLVAVYRRFRGPCCLHHQGEESYHPDDGSSKDPRRYNPEDSQLHTHRRVLCKKFNYSLSNWDFEIKI
jgi:hypothetical protein